MKEAWYQFMRSYVALGLFFYFKRIKVFGRENIPKKGAILFVCNHPNALLDPLLVKTSIRKNLYVLTRAGVFKNNFLIKVFDSFKMIPIYRKRDGWNSISKNDGVFDKCHTILNEQKSILIFPEGSHSLLRKVRPLTKGFPRIIFGAFEKYPDLDVKIVPIGLNYSSIQNYPSTVSIYYGKPISANQFWDKDNLLESIDNMKSAVHDKMKVLTTHISNVERYDEIYTKLETLNVDYQSPDKMNEMIKNIDDYKIKEKPSPKKTKSILYYIVIANSIIPWKIWKKAKTKIAQKEFISTFRYGLGIALFPFVYILQSLIIYFIFDKKTALLYFVFCILSGLLLTKTGSARD